MGKRKVLFLILAAFVIFNLTFVIAPIKATAQHLYLRMYWIVGDITDPDGKGIEGRWVVFYPSDTSLAYSDDIAGTAGNSGRANQYMINAYEDWRMNLDLTLPPGTYKCAIVNGYVNGVLTDDYGADPVDVVITGNGYDVAPTLVLARGAGIAAPGPRPLPDWLLALLPTIKNIKFGERLYQRTLVAMGDKFIISNRPKISAKVTSTVPLIGDSVVLSLNEGTAAVKTYRVSAAQYTGTKSMAEGTGLTEIDFLYDFTKEPVDALPESKDPQDLTIKASNMYGTSVEVCTVYIAAGELELTSDPIAYPSPVRLRRDREVTLQYGISKDANIDIYIFDISARIIKKLSFAAGSPGGQASGKANPNKVTWNLISDQGSLTGSGIYVFNVIDRGRNRVLGKGKITIVPQ